MPVSWMHALPKVELHCHLDGSVSPATIALLLRQQGIAVPEDVNSRLRVSADCSGLPEYLACFDLPLQCLRTEEALETAAVDVVRQLAEDGVRYGEIRFAPLLHTRRGLSARQVLNAVIHGADQAMKETGILVSFIVCAMRHETVEANRQLFNMAADYLGRGVCALDLAGDETAYPTQLHRPLFEEAAKLGIPFTIHAGECGSADEVREALSLGARRIGHGIALRRDARLMEQCREAGVVLELCPTSNFQTKAVPDTASYPFAYFLERGLKVTVNTDNRTVSHTTLTDELLWTANQYHLTREQVIALVSHAIDGAFAGDAVKQKLRQELGGYDAGSR